MKKPLRVIHIMTHPPAYEAYANQPRPKINWDTPDASWVGIWGYDWADLLAIEVRKINEDIVHEIWQPDLRADKVYSHEIYPGVVHRMFPAQQKTRWVGLKRHETLISPMMGHFLEAAGTVGTIFHMGQSVTQPINEALLRIYTKVKFIFSFHGQIVLPGARIFRFQKNIFAKINYLLDHFQARKLFKKISYLTYQSDWNLEYLDHYYEGERKKLTMGLNFDQYQGYEKENCREDLGLPKDRKILITLSRLYDLKQVDHLIEILSKIQNDFLFIVVGHGTREYEAYLRKKAESLLVKNKIAFVGYRSGTEKIKYLNASDLFIHVSKSEAGPVVNMEAMACRLPILTTNTGNTAEFLKENVAGRVVGVVDYQQWQIEIENFLNGREIKVIDFELAKRNYDWQNIAGNFNEIYKMVLEKRVGDNENRRVL